MFAQDMNIFDWRGPEFLGFYLILFAVCFGVAMVLRRKSCVPVAGESPNTPELNGYAAAYLNGGPVLTVNTAIANLINQKALRVDTKTKQLIRLTPEPKFEHDLERVVYTAANSASGENIANIRSAARPFVADIAEDLKKQGLVVADSAARKAIFAPLMIALVAVAVGVIKIMVGINRDKPVGFLVVLCLLSAAASFIVLARRPLRSRYGDHVLKQLKEHYTGPRHLGRNVAHVPASEFAMTMGLFGMSILVGSELSDLRNALQPPGGVDGGFSGCGGGSSCGGGGGGGGGCGGCGGH
jgi:uncharacterized protein (TIGR04222 family)